jgi:hypothetical protein
MNCPFCQHLLFTIEELSHWSVDCRNCAEPVTFSLDRGKIVRTMIYILKEPVSQTPQDCWSILLNPNVPCTTLRKHLAGDTKMRDMITFDYLAPITPANARHWVNRLLNMKAFL